MERRTFGVWRVSIKRRQQKLHSTNIVHWKNQVSQSQVHIDSELIDQHHTLISSMYVQVSLSGETNKIYTSEGSARAEWSAIDKSMHLPLIWYKVHTAYYA